MEQHEQHQQQQQQQQSDQRSRPTSQRDYPVHRNSRFKGAEAQYYQQKQEFQNQQLNDEIQSHTSNEPTEYEDDDEEEEEEDDKFLFEDMRYSDARKGICSVCNYSLKGGDANPLDFEKALLCSDGHLLCHHCVQRFSIQSDTNCVVCAATESQQSISSASRASSVKKPRRRSRASPVHGRRNDTDAYSAAGSRVNIASHYNIGLNYAEDNWTVSQVDSQPDDVSDGKSHYVPIESKAPSYSSIAQRNELSSTARAQINSQMISECSRRPIQCPRLDCAVNIAFSALTNHFIFDHPEVPILTVDPGEKSTIIVNFDGLCYNSSRCLALLLVSGKLSGPAARQFNGSNVNPRYKNRLPLPILAARLHCYASQVEDSQAAGEGEPENGGDVIIAWVAGLDIGNSTSGVLRCSIQAIDSIDGEAFRSLTYTGPINSLRTAQKPREVFHTGDCVILHDGFINHITSGCENLNVNVTIY